MTYSTSCSRAVVLILLSIIIIGINIAIYTDTIGSSFRSYYLWNTEPQWISQSESVVLHLNSTRQRLKSRNLGCFLPLGNVNKINVSREGLELKNHCLTLCSKRKARYAGINYVAHSCLCSKYVNGFISSWKEEITAASRWDLANHCKNPESYTIYGDIKDFSAGSSTSQSSMDFIGCVSLPKKINGSTISLRNESFDASKCVRVCEDRDLKLAIPVTKRNICLCSDFISLFPTVHHMKNLSKDCLNNGESDQFPVFRTSIEEKSCAMTFLPEGQGLPVFLVSFPGSGNTWTRHLIEVSTGVYTGSVYNDKALYEGGFFGESTEQTAGRTIAIKTHMIKQQYRFIILLIRNPYDATLSEWSRQRGHGHTAVPDASNFLTPEFKNFAESSKNKWAALVRKALLSSAKVLVLYYEYLQQDPVHEMRRLAKFIPTNFNETQEAFERRLFCMELDLTGNFKRPSRKLDFNPFNASRTDYSEKIREVEGLMKEHFQPPLPESYFRPYGH